MAARRITLRVQPPIPFVEFTMVPAPLSGRPEAEIGTIVRAQSAGTGSRSRETALLSNVCCWGDIVAKVFFG